MISDAKGTMRMIRLTLTLLAAIGVTLSIAGGDIPDASGAVPGAASASAGAAGAAQASRARATPTDDLPARLALDDEAGAIARALSAEAAAPAPGEDLRLWAVAAEQAGVEPADPVIAAEPEPAPRRLARVNATRVNLRAGPSTANAVLDQVVLDQRVEVLEARSDGWSRIRLPETGRTAWIFDRFLTPLG